MKQRSRAENAAHSRAQREKKRLAAVSPDSVPPVSPIAKVTPDVTLPAPGSGTCPQCERLATLSLDQAQEITRLLARIAALEAQVKRHATPDQPPKGNDLEALQKRVIAAKVDRINSFGRNPSIGIARIL